MARGRAARRRRTLKRATRNKGVETAQQAVSDVGEVFATDTGLLDKLAERQERRDFAATGSTSLPLSPRDASWDAGAAAKTLDPGDFGKAFFWRDGSKPADEIGSYKLPFASKGGGSLTAVFRGVTAAAGAIQGARGGAKIPDSDVAGIKGKIGAYYRKAAKKYDDPGIKPPWAANAAEGETAAYLLAYAEEYGDPGLDSREGDADFEARLAFWEAELAPLTEEELALAAMAETLGVEVEEAEFEPPEELTNALQVVTEMATANTNAQKVVRLWLQDFTVETVDPAEVLATDVADTIPDEQQPGSRVVEANPSPAAPASTITGPMAWSAIFAPEGKLTSDRRAFAPESITWRELPLTLMAMTETSEGGHVGAEISGRIDRIWRDEASGLIRGAGVFDDGEYGQKIAGLVEDKTLRGVSVDLAIADYQIGPRSQWFDDQGNWAPKEQADEAVDPYQEDTIAVVLAAEIGMVTVCPFPAFAEAQIAMGDSLVAGSNSAFWTVTQQGGFTVEIDHQAALVASLLPTVIFEHVIEDGYGECVDCDVVTASAAGLVPERPPADWFSDPELDEPTALTIDDDGRIYGHAATWGVCHTGFPGSCRTAPHSASGYRYFHLGEVVCDEGERVPVGTITLDTGHADVGLRSKEATAHYDHTGTVAAHVCVGEDEHGIWVAGALQPDAPADKVRLLRGAKLSGDWRKVDGHFELIALLAVNVPGFPVPRARALVSSIDGGAPEPVTLTAAGIPSFDTDTLITAEEQQRFTDLQSTWIRSELEGWHDKWTDISDQAYSEMRDAEEEEEMLT